VRAVIQRVTKASVEIGGKNFSTIGKGLLVFLGIAEEDLPSDAEYLASKISAIRIFADTEGKMNLDIRQTGGEALIISQFTLHAQTRKGNRPSFIKAARPEKAIPLYEEFIRLMSASCSCQTGMFGADMQISLCNDGPVTIVIDSRENS
jgi:D-aminoacyl-tRNA deacylase